MDSKKTIEHAYKKLLVHFPKLPKFLTEAQKSSILALCQQNDLLCVTPTGSGKSLTMFLTPYMSSIIQNHVYLKSATIIISPLDALIGNMILKYVDIGFPLIKLTAKSISEGDVQKFVSQNNGPVFFITSVETIMHEGYLSSLIKIIPISYVHVDECHVVVQWGENDKHLKCFRRNYSRISAIRCFSENTITLGLFSATLDSKMVRKLKEVVGFDMENGVEVVQPPIRTNIYLDIRHCKQNLELLNFVIEDAKQEGFQMTKTIIFVNSINECKDVYFHFEIELGASAICSSTGQKLFAAFNGETDTTVKESLVNAFTRSDSQIRVMIATIALGMGVDIPDIRRCILYGHPTNLLDCIQKIGRSGRDGRDAIAIIFAFKTSTVSKLSSNFNLPLDKCLQLFLVRSTYKCHNDKIVHKVHEVPCEELQCVCAMCSCCSFCRRNCPCLLKLNIK